MITDRSRHAEQELVGELALIWAEVLGTAQVAPDEDFYELGGDSLGALQIAARCREAGLPVTTADVLTSATVADLARLIAQRQQTAPAEPTASAKSAGGAAGTGQHGADGWLPLTGPQQWALGLAVGDRNRLVKTQVLITQPGADAELVGRAMRRVAAAHPALRLRFLLSDGAVTAQQVLDRAEVPYEHADVGELASLPQEIEAMRQRLTTMIDLSRGPVFATGYVRGPEGEPGRLILAAHQLAIDAASWDLLRRHIDGAFADLVAESDGQPGPAADRYEEWVTAYQHYARSEPVERQLPYWTGRIGPDLKAPDHPVCLAADGRSLAEWLSPEQSAVLLTEIPRRARIRASDLLLGIFARAAADWSGRPGIYLDLLRHGRCGAVGTDLSLTVGYFTTVAPMWLAVPSDATAPQAARYVRSRFAAEPDDGTGYAALRYCGSDRTCTLLAAVPDSEISFSYQSQIPIRWQGSLTTGMVPDEQNEDIPPDWQRPNLIEMACAVIDGRLVAELWYCGERYTPESMRSLLTGHFAAGLAAAAIAATG